MCSRGEKQVVEKDPQLDLMRKLEHAFDDLNNATKHYISAVEGVDDSLERLAVAFRELSQGDVPPNLKDQVDSFGGAVKRQRGAGTPAGNKSNSKNGSKLTPFATVITNRAKVLVEGIKQLMDVVRKKKVERDSAVSKFNSANAKVEAVNQKNLKANRSSSESPEYNKAAKECSTLQIAMETKKKELELACENLMHKRAAMVEDALSGMRNDFFKYWTELGNSIKGGTQ